MILTILIILRRLRRPFPVQIVILAADDAAGGAALDSMQNPQLLMQIVYFFEVECVLTRRLWLKTLILNLRQIIQRRMLRIIWIRFAGCICLVELLLLLPIQFKFILLQIFYIFVAWLVPLESLTRILLYISILISLTYRLLTIFYHLQHLLQTLILHINRFHSTRSIQRAIPESGFWP